MIQPGMMFGGEGPIMNGTWYNPHTGDAFTVRDSFFEDNQYVVTTTDGRYLRFDQLQNYIQSDMKLEDLKKMKVEKAPVKDELPSEVANLIENPLDDTSYQAMLLPEDEELINTTHSLGNLADGRKIPVLANKKHNTTTVNIDNMNSTIIDKALKNTVKPNLSINIEWDNYPAKEIEMLKDIMEIPSDEIVEWYLSNIQFNDFIMAFKAAIDDKIRFGNKAENIEAKVIRLPESEEVITIEAPTAVDSHKDDEGALAKEPEKSSNIKSTKAGRNTTNKTGKTTSKKK